MSVKKNRSSNQNKKIEEKKKHTTHNTHTYIPVLGNWIKT